MLVHQHAAPYAHLFCNECLLFLIIPLTKGELFALISKEAISRLCTSSLFHTMYKLHQSRAFSRSSMLTINTCDIPVLDDYLLLCNYSNQYYAMNNLHQIIFIKYFRNVSTTINKNNLDITYFRPWASNSNMRVSLKEKVVMPLIFFNAYLHT